jgi:hypothetical protein
MLGAGEGWLARKAGWKFGLADFSPGRDHMRTVFQKVCTVGLGALAGLAGSAMGSQPVEGGAGGSTGVVADVTPAGTNVVSVVAPMSPAADELLTKLENADKALTTL